MNMAIQDCKINAFKLLLYGTLFYQLTITDATITWTLPPPQRGPLQTSDTSVRQTIQQVINGSSEAHLTWNFTLSGAIFDRVIFQKAGNVRIGKKTSSGIVSVEPADNFQEHFGISRSDPATLIIYNVTEADEVVFACSVETNIKTWTDEIKVQIVVETSFTSSPSGDQTVNEGSNLTLFCDATGKPTPNVTWTRVLKNGTDGDEVFFGNPWVIGNISRTVTGTYRCTAYNGIRSPVNHSLYVNVTYKPEIVTMVTNTTENKDCSDLWVNFTCISSEANPPVYSYLLSDDEDGFNFSESGSWILKISRGGESIYMCTAYQHVGNVTSTNNITMTVNVPLVVGQTENKTVREGDSAELSCNMSGIPDPTFIWTKVQDGGYNAEEGKLLSITNITRAQAGKYKCNANNTCGEKSTVAYVDVQYGPENVRLTTNTTNKVCTGVVINFTCTAKANPPVHTYLLYENDTVIKNMGISGTWIKTMENDGQFVFRCEANNSIQGIETSDDTVLTFEVPASVEPVKNINVTEGENVDEYCNVTAGIPDPTVMWTNVKTGKDIKENPLNFTRINRTQAGEYRCTANNTCGEASTVMNINVQYKPENVHVTTNTTSKVCTGDVINFTCTAEANPPVHTYLLYENGTVFENMAISQTWIKTMENAGQFVYRCEANNSIPGIETSDDTILTVGVPASVEQVKNILNVTEGENVDEYCNVTAGIPDPTVMWTNVKTGKDIKENPLNITSINRTQAGEYRCTANNTCGEASTVIYINVQYPPVDIRKDYTIDVLEGHSTKINCEVHGNPPPSITWYKGNDTSGTMINTNGTLMFTETFFNDSGWYTYLAQNFLGNISVTIYLRVEKPSTPITSTEPMTEDPGNTCKASNVSGTMKVTNELFKEEFTNLSSAESRNLTKRCKNGFREVYKRTEAYKDDYNDTGVNKFENGSVVVFFTIIFNDEVCIDDAILVLKQASKNGAIGDLVVEPESIKLLLSVPTTSATSSPTATTTATPGHDAKLWIIIGALAGGAIVLVVIVVVAWCVHHKRKCRRKGSKVRCSESEEQAFTPREDNDPGHVNNGYAEAGPRPTAMVNMSQHQGASVAPTYAVVDKSAKKGNMKDKKDEEKKPQTEPPQYSVVDKPKKKKKKKEEEPEATYAQVNMSKKSKKKAKPGEVLYADLGDFHQMQELPNVSTSPKALPPIKKPAPYVETQYADITQFLKGNVTLPDSEKSQGPATDTQPAPVPENQEGQEPGTSAKETSQASNPGGDGGPDHETNF